MCNICLKLNIPERLHKKGRAVDNKFDENELIYRRFPAKTGIDFWKKDEDLSTFLFAIRSDSYNRDKYSDQPQDVLFNTREQDEGAHYIDYGILSINSSILSNFKGAIQNDTSRVFKMELNHVPEECMYPHCEIKVLVDGQEKKLDAPPKSIRALVRDFLIKETNIITYPTL